MDDGWIIAAIWALAGFQWGQWWAMRGKPDPRIAAGQLVENIGAKALEAAKFVSPETVVQSSITGECRGRRMKITVEIGGQP